MNDRRHRLTRSLRGALIACMAVILLAVVSGCDRGPEIPDTNTTSGTPKPSSAPGKPAKSLTPGEHKVGQPIQASNTAKGAFTSTATGEPLAAYVASGVPATLNVISTRSGELVSSATLKGGANQMVSSRALTSGVADRRIYIGLTDGRAFSYDVDSQGLTRLPQAPGMDRSSFWNSASLDDGRVLFSTYPDARLLAFDPSREKWQDFGALGEGNDYAMGISTVRGMAYVGTGTNSPALWQVNTNTGSKRKIDLPAPEAGARRDFIYDTAVIGTKVFARVDSEQTIYGYDAKNRTWSKVASGAVRGLATSPPDEPGRLYWTDQKGHLHALDPASGKDLVVAGGESFGEIRGYSWQDADANGSNESLVSINASGEVVRWNAESDRRTLLPNHGLPAPLRIRSLGTDLAGNVLAGAMGTAPFFARYPLDGGEAEQYPIRGQIESFGRVGGDLAVGTYPGAEIELVPGDLRQPARAPRRWEIGHGQDRPLAIEGLGKGRFAVATMPVYGKTGGAVAFLEADGGIEKVLTDVTPGRTPLALAYSHGKLYVGTGNTGGLGSELDPGDGTVVVLDARTGSVLQIGTPLPGDATVSSLLFDESGRLWGWGVDSVFELDPRTLKVVQKARFSAAKDAEPYARGRNLVDLGSRLAGSSKGKIFLIDKESLKRQNIAKGSNLVLGGDGELYYSRGSTVFRWSFGPKFNE